MKKLLTISIALFLISTIKNNTFGKNIEPNFILADSVDLNQYVGKYKLAEGGPVEAVVIVIVEGKLVARAGEYPEAILSTKLKDVFEDTASGGIFSFTRVDNKVKKLKIEIQGFELLADLVDEEKK